MKIVFIKPPQTYLFDPERNPPIGMMYIASVAKNLGHDVGYIDLSAKKIDENFGQLVQFIPEAELYGITVSILDYEFSLRLSTELKRRRKCIIVFGGSLPTTAPEYIDFGVVDSVVMGEGEISFAMLLNGISGKKEVSQRYLSPRIKDLDSIAFPLREGVKFISNELVEKGLPATTIITSRGCPFDCTFCASTTFWGRGVRFRSADNVLDEVDLLVRDHNVKGLKFLDDTLTLHKDFKKICQGLQKRNIAWRCSTRSNLITKDLANFMRSAGCREVGVGVESADPYILSLMNKRVSVEEHERAIGILKDAGIKVACFFIAGLPGEQENTPDLNIAFIERTNPDRVFCTAFMPYPGTPIWNNPGQYKMKILSRDISKYNQVSGAGEEDREFVAVPEGLTYELLARNRKKMVNFLFQKGKVAAPPVSAN